MRWFCFALLMALIHPIAVQAQTICLPQGQMEAGFLRKYQERPIAAGLSKEGVVIEVLSTEDRRTWTILVVRPDGNACYLTSGAAWQTISKPQEGTSANGRSG